MGGSVPAAAVAGRRDLGPCRLPACALELVEVFPGSLLSAFTHDVKKNCV